MPGATNGPTDIRHRLFARVYPRIAAMADKRGARNHRRELLGGLTGRVVEVGAGNGANFGHYPATVSEVIAVEPEPRLRELAEEAAAAAPVPVHVVPGTAESLPLDDDLCDAGVLSLVLCSLPDVDAALRELRRVVRPGGEVRFYEHVRADRPWGARAQRVADLVWPHVAGGCHLSRDSVGAIERNGLEVTSSRKFRFLSAPHVIGTARLPAGPRTG